MKLTKNFRIKTQEGFTDVINFLSESVYFRDGRNLDTRIQNEVDTLNNRIDTEVDTLNDRIDTEVDTLEKADAAEEKTRKNEIVRVEGLIAAEQTARAKTDSALATDLNKEIQDRIDAVDNEKTARETAINGINTRIGESTIEKETLTESIAANTTAINNNATNITANTNSINNINNIIPNLQNDIKNNLDNIALLQNRDTIRKLLYPSLSTEQQNQIRNLCQSYADNKTSFVYTGGRLGMYSNKDLTYNQDGKININCCTFAQLIWMGVSPNTFLNKQDTYDASIVKALNYDWGYKWSFPFKKASGLVRSDGQPFGLKKPNEDNNIGSYSYNSYYSDAISEEENIYQQYFITYNGAADMACELYLKGYEIPISEIERGDMVFFRANHISDTINDENENINFRNIHHVGIATTVDKETGLITFVDCTNFYTNPINIISFSTGSDASVVNSAQMHNTIAMVARHPYAFGFETNVPDKFTI